MSKNKKKISVNPKQWKFLKSRAKRKTYHAGRGSAKTNTIGLIIGEIFKTMPRSRWGLVGKTYIQLDLIVMPEVKAALEMMDIFEYSKSRPYGQYVIGIRPPEKWNTPYKSFGRLGYQYAISHISGAAIQFISEDRAETSRGMNLDGTITDERATVKTDFLNKVIYPTVRANKETALVKDPKHLGIYEFSSAAWNQDGLEMYKMEDKYKEMLERRKNFTHEELLKIPPEYCWLESTCLDNPYTGQEYWDKLKDELDPLIFDIEVANMRMTRMPDGFYHAFFVQKHTYFPKNCYQYDEKTGLSLYLPNDYRADKELRISLDFNAAICWSLVIQIVGNEVRVINSKYVKPSLSTNNTNIVQQNATWFCDSYESHSVKDVFIYGDPNGNSTNAGTSNENKVFFDQYCDILIKRGWRIFRRELTNYPTHKNRYVLINHLLSEDSTRTPKIRVNDVAGNNKAFIIALQSTGFKQNGDKFEKNKSSERTAKHREYATDSTDAFDYFLSAEFKKLIPNFQKQKNHLVIV